MFPPKRDTDANALRRGRVSIPNADYFVTISTSPRQPILVQKVAGDIIAETHRLEADNSWLLRCATVMPDHIHLFFTLGNRLTLSQCISRLKKIRTQWQDNFYDHRLRSDDSTEATIRYIWMNPYRAGLIKVAETWPHFYCSTPDWEWFSGLTDKGLPFPEWLR